MLPGLFGDNKILHLNIILMGRLIALSSPEYVQVCCTIM